MREPLIFSDMAQRVISGPVQDVGAPGVWRRMGYETADFAGTMVGCTDRTEPAAVTIRLGVTGCWRVWLGIPVFHDVSRIRVRLTGDPCCRAMETPAAEYHHAAVHEMFFKDADLTGRDLVLEGFWNPEPKAGALAWVRLEPLEQLPEPVKMEIAHPLALTEDAHGVMFERPHQRREDMLEDYAALPPNTALKIMLWAAVHGDLCSYPTRIGQYALQGYCADYPRLGDVVTERNFEWWKKNGWDTVQVARDYCRGRGWEFHLGVRIQTFSQTYPEDETGSTFFWKHPECWCRDKQGRPITRMSFAHPAVQERFLGIADELVAYGPEGVNLMLIRGLPLVLYEPVMVEGFEAKHGVDPRTLEETDPRWTAYQASVITELMRKVKARLKGKMRLSAIVPGRPADLLRFGLDVKAWVAEGIMDDLYPMGQNFTDHNVHRDAPEELDYAWFDGLPGRERIRLIPMLYPWRTFRESRPKWKQIVRTLLAAGAQGYGVWDGCHHAWQEYVDLGLAAPPDRHMPVPRLHVLTMIGGFRVDRYHPIEPF